jgi:branched-chain amino acid transport system permease protein
MFRFCTILILGLTAGLTYSLLGLGFGIIFFVTGRFHFAFSVLMTLAGYLVAWGVGTAGWGLAPAIVIALLAGVIGGVACELGVYRLLDRRAGGSGLLGVFIASLGLVIGGVAAIQLIWQSAPSFSFNLVPLHVWHIGGASVSLLEITIMLTAFVLCAATALLVDYTSLGRQFRAIEADRELAKTYGLKVGQLVILVFIIGSLCSAVAGILIASQYSASSGMGNNYALYALLVAFLSQGRRSWWYLASGVGVGLFQAIFGQFYGAVWQEIAVFVALFILIASMPYQSVLKSELRRAVRAVTGQRPKAA